MYFQHSPLVEVDEIRDLYENYQQNFVIQVTKCVQQKLFLPGFVPIIDFSNFHFGMRGSRVWKNTHIHIATKAANTP